MPSPITVSSAANETRVAVTVMPVITTETVVGELACMATVAEAVKVGATVEEAV